MGPRPRGFCAAPSPLRFAAGFHSEGVRTNHYGLGSPPEEKDASSQTHFRPILAACLVPIATTAALLACGAGTELSPAPVNPTPPAVLTPPGTSVTPDELQERYGIHVSLIAITAAGGLIDVRLKVTDASGAIQIFNPGSPPVLMAIERGVEIVLPAAPATEQPESGQTYFFLYPSTRGALRPGSTVTLAFGDLGIDCQVAP